MMKVIDLLHTEEYHTKNTGRSFNTSTQVWNITRHNYLDMEWKTT